MAWRKRVCAAVATVLFFALAGAAHAALFLAADATGDPGYIRLTAIGSTSLDNVRFGELRHHHFTLLGTADGFAFFEHDDTYGDVGAYTEDHAATWRCDRRTRTFAVYADEPDGTEESNSFTVRTPSCSHRFTFDGPLKAKPGSEVKIFVHDTFGLGGTHVAVCRRAPGAPAPKCQRVTFATGQTVARTHFTVPAKGRWPLVVKAAGQRIERVISVGVKPRPGDLATLPSLVTTGDSLMQGPDALLEDRLDSRAVVHSDVHVGSGLTRPFIVDWSKLPGRQIRKYKPDAVMLFLGANDNGPIQPAGGGAPIQCCGADWIAAYEVLIKAALRTYIKGGAQVFWLNVPIPEDPRRQPNALAVNQALADAVKGKPDAHLVDISAVFTPGNVYRETMVYRGRTVHIRQSDGLHLSVAGSSITDTILIAQLKKYGVL